MVANSDYSDRELLEIFVAKLLREKENINLSKVARMQLKEKMVDELNEKINFAILEDLPEEKIAQLEDLMENYKENREKISEILDDLDDDKISEKTSQIMEQYRADFLKDDEEAENE